MARRDKIVKVDIDGVIRDLPQAMCRVYNIEFNKFLLPDEIVKYDVSEMFPDIQNPFEFFFEGRNAEDVFLNALPYAFWRSAFEKLIKECKVVLVTWQHSFENRKYTLEWLERWSVPYDDICFTKDKYIVQGDYLIDDNPDFLLDERDKSTKIRIERPYNKYLGDTFFHAPNIDAAVNAIISGEV